MQFKHATLDIDGSVAVLKLDHQEVMNAVSVDMLGGLGEALDVIDEKQGRSPLPRHHRRGARVLHRRQPSGPQQPNAGQEQRRRHPGNRLPSVPAPPAQPALPDRDLRQWTGRRRRDELRADGRHDPVRALVLFPAGVPAHRPRARLRIDLAAAAAGRQGPRGRTVADGRKTACGEGAGMGARQPGL